MPNGQPDQQFNVVFKGDLVKGATVDQVKSNLAKLFKADPAKLEHLFAGKAVIIKKGLDLAGADKYESVLRRAGAIVELLEVGAGTSEKGQRKMANLLRLRKKYHRRNRHRRRHRPRLLRI